MEAEKLLQEEEEQERAHINLEAKTSHCFEFSKVFLRCCALLALFVSYILVWMLAKSQDEGHRISDYG